MPLGRFFRKRDPDSPPDVGTRDDRTGSADEDESAVDEGVIEDE